MNLFYLLSLLTILLSGFQSPAHASVRNGTIELLGACEDALISSYHSFEMESGPFELRRLLDEMISFRKADFVANLQALYPNLPSDNGDQNGPYFSFLRNYIRHQKKFVAVAPNNPLVRYQEREGSGAMPYTPVEAFLLQLIEESVDEATGNRMILFEMTVPELLFSSSERLQGKSLRFRWKQKVGAPALRTIASQLSESNSYFQALEMISLGGLYERHTDSLYWKSFLEEKVMQSNQDILGVLPANGDSIAARSIQSNMVWLVVGTNQNEANYLLLYDLADRQLIKFYELPNTLEILIPQDHRSLEQNRTMRSDVILGINHQKGTLEAYRVLFDELVLVDSQSIGMADYGKPWNLSNKNVTTKFLPERNVFINISLEYQNPIQDQTEQVNASYIFNGTNLIELNQSRTARNDNQFNLTCDYFFSPGGDKILGIEHTFDANKFLGYKLNLWTLKPNQVYLSKEIVIPADLAPRPDWRRLKRVQWVNSDTIRLSMHFLREDFTTEEEYTKSSANDLFWMTEARFLNDSIADTPAGLRFCNTIEEKKSFRESYVEYIADLPSMHDYSDLSWFGGKLPSGISSEALFPHYYSKSADATSRFGYFAKDDIFFDQIQGRLSQGIFWKHWNFNKSYIDSIEFGRNGFRPEQIGARVNGIAILGAFDATIVAP